MRYLSNNIQKGASSFEEALLLDRLIQNSDYSGKEIASLGHTLAHVPHSVHISGLIEYFSPSEIAPTGHSSIHVPQAMQLSPIT